MIPQNHWGVLGSFLIGAVLSCGELHAVQEPVMRVLVMESKQLRFRADGDKPLLVKGISGNQLRVSTLKIRQKNNQFQIGLNDRSNRWFGFPVKAMLNISSRDSRGIWLGKRRYRGELRVYVRDGQLKVVNHLGLEKYLVSVVGSEMPKSWPMAALKAQAIAARTYALQQLGKKSLYDISSTEANQVYLGVESETKNIRKAVLATRSLVLTHKGKLIDAVFHSSSGGFTEASGAVWKRQMPYLVSVPDHDQHSPTYKWVKEYDPTQLEAAFFETGGLKSIKVLRVSDTGRILTVRVDGPQGRLELTGKELRRRLKLKSTLASFHMTPYQDMSKRENMRRPSSLFSGRLSVSKKDQLSLRKWSLKQLSFDSSPEKDFPLIAINSLPRTIPKPPPIFELPPHLPLPSIYKKYNLLVKGSGAGHGVGMSQWGAHGLAEKGADFRRILNHYYTGVVIKRYSAT